MVAPLPVAWFKLPLWGFAQIWSLTGGALIHLHPGCSMLNWPPFSQESSSKSLGESCPQLSQKANSKQRLLLHFFSTCLARENRLIPSQVVLYMFSIKSQYPLCFLDTIRRDNRVSYLSHCYAHILTQDTDNTRQERVRF